MSIEANEKITPEEFARRMSELDTGDNYVWQHREADELMCEVLRSLGYGEGVDIFEKMDKWYA